MGQIVNKKHATLHERTRELLQKRPRGVTLRVIAAESGLSYTFVHAMSRKESSDPGVNKTQQLFEYLAGRPLEY